jgi:hypothetical protein
MLMPTKHVTERNSILGAAGVVLSTITGPTSINELRRRTSGIQAVGTFDRLVLALDFLFMIGVIEFQSGLIGRAPTCAC